MSMSSPDESDFTGDPRDDIAAAVASLRAGEFADYDVRARALTRDGTSDRLWVSLARAHGTEVDLFERLLAWPRETFRASLYRLAPAVSHLPTLSLADARGFLDYAARSEISYGHLLAEQLRPHFAANPELAWSLIDDLRQHAGRPTQVRRIWAGSFASAAPEPAARAAASLLLTAAGEPSLGAVLLQYLPMADSAVSGVLLSDEDQVVGALVAAAPSVGEDAWFALSALANLSSKAMESLGLGVAAAETQAVLAMAALVSRVGAPTVGATNQPTQAIVRALIAHAVKTEAVRTAVDSAVASLLYRDSLRALVRECVVDLGGVGPNVTELLPAVMEALEGHPEDFELLLTAWLVAEGVRFNNVRSLLSRCVSMRAPATLHVPTFAAASTTRKVVAARRLLSLTHHGPVLCQFIACLAETPALQPYGLELAAQMLNAAYAEYPNATFEFLQPRTRSAQRREPYAHVYRAILSNALRWRRVLQRLPRLQELRTGEAQRQALQAVRQRINRDIMKAAEDGSVMAVFATKVNIAQGRRSATHTAFGPPQVVEMQRHSYAIELPSSELADPVGGLVRRRQQLMASQ